MAKKVRKVRVYMCATDFSYELGEASGGCVIYPSMKDALDCRGCLKSCGIVEVEVAFKKNVLAGDMKKGCISFADIEAKNRKWASSRKSTIKYMRKHLEVLEKDMSVFRMRVAGLEYELKEALNAKRKRN